ncbi:hypothetical protein PI124_g23003 [Phytophthora idaei]|nr:hypothetical protein PI125_g23229 [Phytophthora idaei]KAG3125080.1 hypothetical protein PI126_g22934 [Phytophthora idaei]KAG3231903.1 hypothetical protein PI124_g23003 [Phytophthora idaei]
MSVPLLEVFERMCGVGIDKLALLSLDQNGMKLASLLGVGSDSSFEHFTFLCESSLQCADHSISLNDLSSRQFQVGPVAKKNTSVQGTDSAQAGPAAGKNAVLNKPFSTQAMDFVQRVKVCRLFHLLKKCVDTNVSSSQTTVLCLEWFDFGRRDLEKLLRAFASHHLRDNRALGCSSIRI